MCACVCIGLLYPIVRTDLKCHNKLNQCTAFLTPAGCRVGLVVRVSASRAADPGFDSRLGRDFFGLSHTSDLKLVIQWLPCQASGVIGSAMGLVGLVSVYCDWVR